MESDICDLDKKIAEERVLLGQKELALKYSDDNVEAAKDRWQMHHKNHQYMRKHDYVEIREWSENRRLLKTTRDEYDENLARNAELRGAAQHYRKSIADTVVKRDALKAQLEGYGQILEFKRD